MQRAIHRANRLANVISLGQATRTQPILSSGFRPFLGAKMMAGGSNGVQPRRSKVLTMDTMNPHIKVMEYAVRGPIVARATELEKELEQARFILSCDQWEYGLLAALALALALSSSSTSTSTQ